MSVSSPRLSTRRLGDSDKLAYLLTHPQALPPNYSPTRPETPPQGLARPDHQAIAAGLTLTRRPAGRHQPHQPHHHHHHHRPQPTGASNELATIRREQARYGAAAPPQGMLPVYNNDYQMHHRVSSGAGASPAALLAQMGSGASALGASFSGRQSTRRRLLNNVCQAVVLVLVLLPLYMLVSDKLGPGRMSSGHRKDVARKLMKEAAAEDLPASHLKNLVLVAGHAVYVGLNYGDAKNESSWFLEDYQKVPGGWAAGWRCGWAQVGRWVGGGWPRGGWAGGWVAAWWVGGRVQVGGCVAGRRHRGGAGGVGWGGRVVPQHGIQGGREMATMDL